MAAAARLTDPDSSDGNIIGDVSSIVTINGFPAALIDSVDSSHAPYGKQHPPHQAPTIMTASSIVTSDGRGLARVGDTFSCGHVIESGSPNVTVG